MIPCVRVKDGVRFDRIAPAGFKILSVIQNATFIFDVDMVITSGTDSHPPNDPHTEGAAYDIRTSNIPDKTVLDIVKYLRANLGPAFFVQYESKLINPNATAPHIHVQRKAGTVYPPIDNL